MTEGKDAKSIPGYTLVENLGSGQYAVVKLARHDLTGARVAIKTIDKTKLGETDRKHLFREVSCMQRVQHPSIIRLYEVYDTPTKLHLVLELGENGDLYDYIANHTEGVGEDESRDLFRQIVQAISYCHGLHVVHRDLKPENIVFCQNATRVKVTDFGLSNLFAPGEQLKTSCGSLSYAAPEILLGDNYDAPAVDVWSLGVLLYMLLVGEKPFCGGTDSETLAMIMDCQFYTPDHLSTESVDLVSKMLVSDPKKRFKLEDIFNHTWMTRQPSSKRQDEDVSMRTLLGEECHQSILQQMVQKGSAEDTSTIESSLAQDLYDHLSATYHLMAAIAVQEKCCHKKCQDVTDGEDLERLRRRRRHVRSSVPCPVGNLRPVARSRVASLPSVTADALRPSSSPALSPSPCGGSPLALHRTKMGRVSPPPSYGQSPIRRNCSPVFPTINSNESPRRLPPLPSGLLRGNERKPRAFSLASAEAALRKSQSMGDSPEDAGVGVVMEAEEDEESNGVSSGESDCANASPVGSPSFATPTKAPPSPLSQPRRMYPNWLTTQACKVHVSAPSNT